MRFSKNLFIACIFAGMVLLVFAAHAPAAHAQSTQQYSEISLQVQLPGSFPCTEAENAGKYCVRDLGEYILNFYKWFVSISGVLAIIMILLGGFRWITSAGNSSKITEAKEIMNGALAGVVLTMLSFLLLQLINPQILSLRLPISNVERSEFLLNGVLCGSQSVKESPSTLTCGMVATVNIATAGGAEQHCIWDKCLDPAKEICAPNFKTKKYECMGQLDACNQTEPKNCSTVDQRFKETNAMYGGRTLSCLKRDVTQRLSFFGYPNDCAAGTLWSLKAPLPTKDLTDEKILSSEYACDVVDVTNYLLIKKATYDAWVRLECNAGQGKTTPCWNGKENKPAQETFSLNNPWWSELVPFVDKVARLTCSDSDRANQSASGVCCGKKKKGEINCRENGENNEVEVPCDFYNNDPDEAKVEYQEVQGGKKSDTCVAPNHCWMEVDFFPN